jgi:hypothetical protein
MTEENPVTEIETETEAHAEIETEAQAEAHSVMLERLREAGEAGKKEWEDILTKAGGFVRERGDELKTNVEGAFSKAQTRGADLLLKLVSQVRKGVVSFEDSLRDVTVDTAEEAPVAA